MPQVSWKNKNESIYICYLRLMQLLGNLAEIRTFFAICMYVAPFGILNSFNPLFPSFEHFEVTSRSKFFEINLKYIQGSRRVVDQFHRWFPECHL